jgi:hypothetical protein
VSLTSHLLGRESINHSSTLGFLVVTAARWDVICDKEKDELLATVERHFAYNVGGKKPQALVEKDGAQDSR